MEQLLEALQAQLDVEVKIKDGAENLLGVFSLEGKEETARPAGAGNREQLRKQVQEELESAAGKITRLYQSSSAVSVWHACIAPRPTQSP